MVVVVFRAFTPACTVEKEPGYGLALLSTTTAPFSGVTRANGSEQVLWVAGAPGRACDTAKDAARAKYMEPSIATRGSSE